MFHQTHNTFAYTLSSRILALIRIYLLHSPDLYTYLSIILLYFVGPPPIFLTKVPLKAHV